jgi:hypothetical protein
VEQFDDPQDEVDYLRDRVRTYRQFIRDHAIAHHGAHPWTMAEIVEFKPNPHRCSLVCRNPEADRLERELRAAQEIAAEISTALIKGEGALDHLNRRAVTAEQALSDLTTRPPRT